jgi:LPS sulfotransferase NodH
MSHVNFVVLTSSRTGSTWLIDLLNMQPGVEAHGELFLKHGRLSPAIAGRTDYRRFVEVYGSAGITRVIKLFSYLNGLYRAPRTCGFKLMYTQLRAYPEILAYLAIRRVRIVHLTRCNHLDVIVSEELAKLTGISHAQVGTKAVAPMVSLDPATLVERMSRLRRMSAEARRLIRLSMCPCFEVTYEALLNGDQEFLPVLRFLGIAQPTAHLQSSLAKRGARSHRESISNYDQIRQVLHSTPFLSLLR